MKMFETIAGTGSRYGEIGFFKFYNRSEKCSEEKYNIYTIPYFDIREISTDVYDNHTDVDIYYSKNKGKRKLISIEFDKYEEASEYYEKLIEVWTNPKVQSNENDIDEDSDQCLCTFKR